MGRINVISSIFEDSNVQHSLRDSMLTIARLHAHLLTLATLLVLRWHDRFPFHTDHLHPFLQVVLSCHHWFENAWLGRSPHKNYKNDLDDQT